MKPVILLLVASFLAACCPEEKFKVGKTLYYKQKYETYEDKDDS